MLDSIACEGALLASDVKRGRTTTVFAREHAEALRIQSSNFADSLSRRKTVPEIEREVRDKAKEAGPRGWRSESSSTLVSPYQSAWTAAPLCSVATVPLAPHATAADRSGQLSVASCQCLAMPAGDS
jgi:hypothetical protein